MPPLNLDEDESSAPRPTRVRWLVFGLACATSFCLYLHRYTWNFVAPELQAQHGWSAGEVQQAYTLFNITYGLGQIPSGMLIDRHGPRLFLTLIIALWSLIIPLQAAGTWLAVAAARLGLGATQAGCYPALHRSPPAGSHWLTAPASRAWSRRSVVVPGEPSPPSS